jgi:hypothetical protein
MVISSCFGYCFAGISSVEDYSNILQTSLENRLVSIPKDREENPEAKMKSQFHGISLNSSTAT